MRRLLILNGIALIGAVINHAVYWEVTAMFWWTDRYRPVSIPNFDQLNSMRFFSVRLIDQLAFFGVFAFLFISGNFVAISVGHHQKTLSWRLVFQRMKYLLIPYFLWSSVILVLNLLQGVSYTALQIIKIYLLGGASAPYYYVIVLVQLYILSPLLVPLARDRWKILLALTGLLQILIVFANYTVLLHLNVGEIEPVLKILRNWYMLGYVFWFLLGTAVRFHFTQFRPMLYRYRWLLFFGMILSCIVGFIECEHIRVLSGKEWVAPQIILFNRIFVLFLLLCFVAFEHVPLPFSNALSKLGPKSYGIYLVHVIPLELTARLLYHIAPALLAYQVIFMPLLVLAGVSVPIILMEVVNRSFFRPYYKYVFG